MRDIIKYYVLASLAIGFIRIVLNFRGIKAYLLTASGQSEILLEEFVQKGHIQKEVYGDRIVHHPLDLAGNAMVCSGEHVKRMKQKHPTGFLVVFLIFGVFVESIRWPEVLWRYLRGLR